MRGFEIEVMVRVPRETPICEAFWCDDNGTVYDVQDRAVGSAVDALEIIEDWLHDHQYEADDTDTEELAYALAKRRSCYFTYTANRSAEA